MVGGVREDPDSHPPPGVVELREDVPLKCSEGGVGSAGGGPYCAAGPRLILASFAALSAAITIALLTQIYYGDYEVVPHGSVSSSAEACSRAGTDALKAGGGAVDAAAAAAVCLAVLAPHLTSLDASGSLLYWEYRTSRTQPPTLYEWGGGAAAAGGPRLAAALAWLHAQRGLLPWPRILQPAIDLARGGYNVSAGLALAAAAWPAAADGVMHAGEWRSEPPLAAYLESLQLNSSAEVAAALGGASVVRRGVVSGAALGGGRRVLGGGSRAPPALRALHAAFRTPPADIDDATTRVVEALQREAASGEWPAAAAAGVATGLAVVDRLDTYLALVTGLSQPFGSGPAEAAGWRRDEPGGPLDLAPAIMLDKTVCGTRYVVGGESGAALAQGAAALAAGGGPAAVERPRAVLRPGGALAVERPRGALQPGGALAVERPLGALQPGGAPAEPDASLPAAALNLVQQRGDALLSHADSRGGGLASRF